MITETNINDYKELETYLSGIISLEERINLSDFIDSKELSEKLQDLHNKIDSYENNITLSSKIREGIYLRSITEYSKIYIRINKIFGNHSGLLRDKPLINKSEIYIDKNSISLRTSNVEVGEYLNSKIENDYSEVEE